MHPANSNFNEVVKAQPERVIAAALDWWQLAGVSHDFSDTPNAWLSANAPAAAPAPPTVLPMPEAEPPAKAALLGGDAASWPRELADFAPWWCAEPSLDGGQTAGRVAPRGAAGAALMVVVEQPEAQDAEAGQLLSGPQGRLLAAMLAAMGLEAGAVYLAAALPRHMPAPDWAALGTQGLGAVLRHHAGLVRPGRIVSFGTNISSLLAHSPPKRPGEIGFVNHSEGPIALMAACSLAAMLERPAFKAGFWHDWQGWLAGRT